MKTFMFIVFCAFAYLVGSISNAILICRAHKVDIKSVGSGNAGATNTVRALGKKYGVLVFLLDFLKGVVSCIPMKLIFPEYTCVAGFFAVVGHIFPVFFKFKGGKGVSTTFGAILMFNPLAAMCTGVLELILIAVTKIVSLSTVISFIFLPVSVFVFSDKTFAVPTYVSGLTAILVLISHRSNIRRLLKGEENTFRKKNK